MKNSLTIIGANLFSIICALAAVYMAVNHIVGWGWFLFVAVITISSFNFKD
jgi:hypothetical protein